AVGRLGLGKTVVDVCAQRVQRQTTLEIPLRARDLVTVQTARHANLDALAAEAQSGVNRLAHRATEADSLLKLQRDVLGYQLSVELRLVDLKDVDKHLAVGALLDVS